MEMAQYVKSLDPNHLLSVGAEGFYAHSAANPGGATSCALRLQLALSGGYASKLLEPWTMGQHPWWTCTRRWAANEGQDFVLNNNVAGIDFATFHCWPDKCVHLHLAMRAASLPPCHHVCSPALLHAAGWTTACNSRRRGCGSMPQMQQSWGSRCALPPSMPPQLRLGQSALGTAGDASQQARQQACCGLAQALLEEFGKWCAGWGSMIMRCCR